MAGARVTRARLLASAAFAGGIRVSRFRLLAAAGQPGALRVSRFRLLAAVANRPGLGMRVSHFRVLQFRSLNRVFYLTRLESSSTINDFTEDSWLVELVAGPIPEFNPYKPQVPESLIDIGGRDFFDYIEENQKTLRLQHNITQAGDTTFPYQMIINSHSEQQFTLGSIGKFYHEDYGLIHARYVQYDKMNPALQPTAPVGLIKNNGILDWIVTNRLEISDPHLCVGIQASYVMPLDGQFGWVTIDGVNLQSIVTEGDNVDVGVPYVWSDSGKVGPAGEGIVIARRVQQDGDVQLTKGRAYIRLEGLSEGDINKFLEDLIADVNQLKEDVELLKDANDIENTLKSLNAQIKTLQNRLTAEENARKSADTAINKRIDNLNFVTLAQLNSAIAGVQADLASVALGLSNRIDATNAIAVEALAKANEALSLDLESIQTQISYILEWLSSESRRAKGKFPVVDGMVPPNLVYLDDGSLVYVETF